MRRPAEAISSPLTRLLVATIRVYARTGRCTIREAAAEAGYHSVGNSMEYMRQLRDLGLVSWEDQHAGTLRPTVAVVLPRRAA